MPPRNIAIDTITKIEGNAGLKVLIEDEEVKDLQVLYDGCKGQAGRRGAIVPV
jgi:hypothetical protein